MSLIGHMAISNRGAVLHLPNSKHPRKALLDKLGVQSCQKIYRDTKAGAQHVGYVVRGEWWDILEVHSWKGGETLTS